jgi:hypothetical protein
MLGLTIAFDGENRTNFVVNSEIKRRPVQSLHARCCDKHDGNGARLRFWKTPHLGEDFSYFPLGAKRQGWFTFLMQ